MEQNLLGGDLIPAPIKDSIHGKASEMPAALSMVRRFIWKVPWFVMVPCMIQYEGIYLLSRQKRLACNDIRHQGGKPVVILCKVTTEFFNQGLVLQLQGTAQGIGQ